MNLLLLFFIVAFISSIALALKRLITKGDVPFRVIERNLKSGGVIATAVVAGFVLVAIVLCSLLL